MTGNTLPKGRIICSHIVNIQSSSSCSDEQCVPSDYSFVPKDWQQEIIQATENNL
jgi:hypothetical protein